MNAMFNRSITIRGIKLYVAETKTLGPPRIGVVFQKSAAGCWADISVGARKLVVGWWRERTNGS